MIPFLSAISLILPVGLGFILVRLLWPRNRPLGWVMHAALSVGFGCGAGSAWLFIWLLATGRPSRLAVLTEAAAVLLLTWLAFFRRRRGPGPGSGPGSAAGSVKPGPSRLLICGACLVTLLAAGVLALRVGWTPHGDRDAWGSWNMKARMIYLAGENWRDVFSNHLPDEVPDYPLLLPLTVTGLWLEIGTIPPMAPALLAVAFTCATVMLLGSGLSVLRDTSEGVLAATVLVATPAFLILGTAQYADVVIEFFFLATLVLLAMYEREQNPRLLVLAGLAAGFAAWTKNEGVVFLIVAGAAVMLAPALRGRRWRGVIWFAAGAALPVIMVVYLKRFLAGAPNLMVAGQGLHQTIEWLTDLSRYRMVAAAFASQFAHLGKWPVSIGLLLLLYAALAKVKRKSEIGVSFTWLFAVVSAMFAAYFMIFELTPFDLELHLITALDRLFMQLWPSVLFVYFLFVRTPAEILAERPAGISRARLAQWALPVLLLAGIWSAASILSARWRGDGRLLELRMEAYERRMSNIKAFLPNRGIIGYTSAWPARMAEFARTQYFLAPLIVEDSPEPELVVLNRYSLDDDDKQPYWGYHVEEHDGMTLHDFGTGVYLEDRRDGRSE
jgi:hypothetical protein